MRRTKEEALATRESILRAALSCFARRGYTLTTFDDIAKLVKVTRGGVFWHFKSKVALLAALIIRETERFEPLSTVETASLEGIRQLFLDWGTAIVTNNRSRQFMIFAMSRMDWSEALKKTLEKQLNGVIQDPFLRLEKRLTILQAEGEIVSELTPAQLAVLLKSIFIGTVRAVLFDKSAIPLLPTIESGLTSFINEIRRK